MNMDSGFIWRFEHKHSIQLLFADGGTKQSWYFPKIEHSTYYSPSQNGLV